MDARAIFIILAKPIQWIVNDPGQVLNRPLKFIEKEGAFFQQGSYTASPT